MNSLLSITSFTYGSDPKAVACLTPLPNEWKCTQSGVEMGVSVSMCVQKHQSTTLDLSNIKAVKLHQSRT